MNTWLKLSIEYANQRNYLDDLFQVYPTIPEAIRDIDKKVWNSIKTAFKRKNNIDLLNNLLKLKLFPIKDSYIAYLRRDKAAINRNPQTVNRICGRLYEIGLDDIFLKSSEPKETNRQMGQAFRNWLNKKSLGITPVKQSDFIKTEENAILNAGDKEMKDFAKTHFNYKNDKGLDFIGRFNGKYVLGEAKFLTDMGGHQNAQFNDAITTLKSSVLNATVIAILDGVLYIKGKNKMYKDITNNLNNENIMSSLVLRNFLYQI